MNHDKKTVLVVDDEMRIRKLLSDFLIRAGYRVMEAADGEEAITAVYNTKNDISLVVLDIMMPKLDGWQVLEKIRECFRTPVILLTAKSEESDQLKGFRMGADDYVTKPFSPSVLVARIDNLLRHDSINGKTLTVGELTVYDEAREVTVQGNHVELTPKEYELLKFLIKNKGKAFSREKLLNAVWSYDYVGDLRTVDTHVKQLRAKLGEDGDCIITVRNVGYKIVE